MNSLASSNLGLEESTLNQGFYFQSLLEEAINKQLLTTEQMERLQISLLELMAKEVERYTNGESSSVLIEKAQELLQSITYLIGIYLKTEPDVQTKLELLKKEKMSVLFYRGLDEVGRIYKEAQLVLKELQNNYRDPKSIAYHDTLFQGLPEFFHDYNMEFGAHELPGSIDYPLLVPVVDYLGVEMTARYLQNLSIEDRIISCFTMERINQLLHAFDREAEHLLINICELIIINSFGCILLNKEVEGLNISKSEITELHKRLYGLNKDEVEVLMAEVFTKLGIELELSNIEKNYLHAVLAELTQRLWNNCRLDTLENFFILTDQEEEGIEEFIDGLPMEDEKLRELIEEINDLNSIEDKADLIRERVRSMADLILILEDCFYEEEYQRLYQKLGEEELQLLKKSLQLEAGSIPMEEYEPDSEWQKQLLLF
jgi:hypothetical protein